MIGLLKGQILSKNADSGQILMLCGEVGYELFVPKNFFDRLIENEPTTVWIHSHVREDAFILFGFASEMEKNFFRLLLSMSGLGPKTALSLLAEHGAERLAQLILAKEVSEISQAQGVGKKLASRMVLELSSKVEKLAWLDKFQSASITPKVAQKAASTESSLRDDLNSALLHLGFHPQLVKTTIERLWEQEMPENKGVSFENLLKSALNEMTARPRAKASMEITGG